MKKIMTAMQGKGRDLFAHVMREIGESEENVRRLVIDFCIDDAVTYSLEKHAEEQDVCRETEREANK